MVTLTVDELQSRAEEYFDAVERGEELEVRRCGKAIALVSPIRRETSARWASARRVKLGNGISLSRAILAERADGG